LRAATKPMGNGMDMHLGNFNKLEFRVCLTPKDLKMTEANSMQKLQIKLNTS